MKADREKLIELLDHATEVFWLDAWENTDKIADYLIEHGVVVIPVRCKDCKYFDEEFDACICDKEMDRNKWFCADGERKEK